MMRRRRRSLSTAPGLMLSPMIDLIFLLLVFFVVSTMYMSNVQTIPVVLPKAEHSEHVKEEWMDCHCQSGWDAVSGG